MKAVDYIIVGFGLAGLAMAKTLEEHNKTFLVLDNENPNSSLVAGGFASPVILKRYTLVWEAVNQLEACYAFFNQFEEKFNETYIEKFPIYRRFASIEEQNNWMVACDKPVLSDYLSSELIHKNIKGIDAPYGYGEVLNSGRILVSKVLLRYKEALKKQGNYQATTFDYDSLENSKNGITYKDIKAKHIVFAEGYAVNDNPYFNHLLLDGAKGEILIIEAPELELNVQLKAGITLLPIGNKQFFVAATFDWNDKTNTPTAGKREELKAKLDKFLAVPYKVIDQKAGVRPTVRDRRPLVGRHPEYKNMYVLNGLGTRGVMIAPAMSKLLFEHIEHGIALPKEVNCERYENHFNGCDGVMGINY